MKGKKAVSGVVVTILMIALVMVTTTIVWGVVKSIVDDKIEESESCFNILDKIILDNDYTCSNQDKLSFSISIGDIDVEEILVSISNSENTKTFRLNKNDLNEDFIRSYNEEDQVIIPDKNSGKVYIFEQDGFGIPITIQIAPNINGNQCDIIDSIQKIRSCD